MIGNNHKHSALMVYSIIIAAFLMIPLLGNRAVTTITEASIIHPCVIIDAGHGGVDSGAISCTGTYESQINLEIAHRLNDFLHLLGIQTVMIRDTDRSIHTEGETIAAKKISDIKERVRIANTTPQAIYLSIHQNHFIDEKYYGSQVFYNSQQGSREYADMLQNAMRVTLNPTNKRQTKRITDVYLMEHINCCGILIECGFLSNPTEERKLRNPEYQKQLAGVIAVTTSQYLNT